MSKAIGDRYRALLCAIDITVKALEEEVKKEEAFIQKSDNALLTASEFGRKAEKERMIEMMKRWMP